MKIPWIEQASRNKKLLVGVSGGLDSMALLFLLHEKGFKKLVVCHLNHELRGKSSTDDASFVKRVSQRLGFEVIVKKIDLAELIESSGDSLETCGRMARHEFFASCSRQQRCNSLLLAHHADDQAETVLWNLLRGSLGCRGMKENTEIQMAGRNINVVRPLIGTRKSELEAWMCERKLKWREDASNAVNDVVRNRLRNEAIPLLGEIAKRDVAKNLVRAAEVDSEWRGLLDWAVSKSGVIDPQGRLHTGAMKKLPAVLQKAVLADYLKSNKVSNIDRDLIDRCQALLDTGNTPCVNLPGGSSIRRRQGRLLIEGAKH